jgi:peptide alpha-N-acetyltransferase
MGMQACNLKNLPENYTMRYCQFTIFVDSTEDRKGRIVGYILAKMDEEVPEGERPRGHVTSISVLRFYRQLGLAKKLVVQAQEAMTEHFMSLCMCGNQIGLPWLFTVMP